MIRMESVLCMNSSDDGSGHYGRSQKPSDAAASGGWRGTL